MCGVQWFDGRVTVGQSASELEAAMFLAIMLRHSQLGEVV
jgi:hypothetical protein